MKFPIYGKIKNVPNHQPDEKNNDHDVFEMKPQKMFEVTLTIP